MSEPTAAPWRTPQGFLIKNDVVYSNNTAFGSGDIRICLATSCELELWQICEAQRDKLRGLIAAAKMGNIFVHHIAHCKNGSIEKFRDICPKCMMEEAIAEAERE